jgi:hypothetical protein
MPFEIEWDGANEVLQKFADLETRIVNLDTELPNTFMNWQRDDMHRHFPKVEGGGLTCSTEIFPRSRLPHQRGKGSGKATRRRARVAAGRPGAHRPILRPELFDMLRQRMIAMCEAALKWQ